MESISTEATSHKERLEWLDAMRGFTMILVVAYHVAQFGFDQTVKHSSSLSFLMLFRMPLFFFVSGFLAYKASAEWNLSSLFNMLAKKFRVQIIPTVVFFKDGKEIDRKVGVMPDKAYAAVLDANL